MALTYAEKQAVVAEVADVANSALSAVAAEYRGLSVSQLTALRASARESGVYVRVVKNSLARLAVKGTEFECMNDRLSGPLMLAFSKEDPGSAARLFRDFAKTNDKLVITVGAVGGETIEAGDINKLANLPTRDEALSLMMAVMQAPVTKLARTLKEVPGKLVRTVEAVRLSKEA
ncbi:50S ribosomal protein L10 [Granulosicoccus antarcticus]|uniref:Large ribosomal subunit protein uL10 n=1 Tax=Granulosicoccus antarcticus IMCC3135 TaxID=1192854 RepID=A0A2Z2NQ31_9GAMM|nr:50S ribosomal protein L10 [Granulosicoccus antarcticus]ASJ71768.1 50S ribosomal protein L10 [Granulosicoccus antarcticus IMCC3135]